jgi:hypothetical protein
VVWTGSAFYYGWPPLADVWPHVWYNLIEADPLGSMEWMSYWSGAINFRWYLSHSGYWTDRGTEWTTAQGICAARRMVQGGSC